ncbi:cold shock domain-containing protein [uncultured Friedmanniella sp.]|uniref:cold shock domain-containing protein n=1 Tax=uncultured Friedmanniella sp. TaxID=335381 RepID=UPI0035CBA005
MPVGRVKFYREPQGVGAISSDALPVGRDAWVHFSMIEGDGYRSLTVGEVVDFEFEEVKQNSFDYRATIVRRHSPPPVPAE